MSKMFSILDELPSAVQCATETGRFLYIDHFFKVNDSTHAGLRKYTTSTKFDT